MYNEQYSSTLILAYTYQADLLLTQRRNVITDLLEIEVTLTNDKVQFTGVSKSNPAITFDYKPPLGDGQGYTGLELLLMSFAACSGTTDDCYIDLIIGVPDVDISKLPLEIQSHLHPVMKNRHRERPNRHHVKFPSFESEG